MERIAFLQEWTESERGWGQRPDGYSLHLTLADAECYVQRYNASLPSGPAPDEYTFADGKPLPVVVTESLYQQVSASPDGVRYWQRALVVETSAVGTRSARERDDTSKLPFLARCACKLATPGEYAKFLQDWQPSSHAPTLQAAVGASDSEWALLTEDSRYIYRVLYERAAAA